MSEASITICVGDTPDDRLLLDLLRILNVNFNCEALSIRVGQFNYVSLNKGQLDIGVIR